MPPEIGDFMKTLIFSLFIHLFFTVNVFSQFLPSHLQESSLKKSILESRELEKTKAERLKMARNQGLQYSGGEIYPSATISWGKGFSGGLAKITVNGKVGFINPKGNVVVKPKLKDAGYFSENLAPFESDDGKWGFIGTQGEIVIKPQFDWALSFKEGLALVESGGLWGFIDKSGQFVIEPRFKEAAGFSEGLARAAIFDPDYVWENTNIPNGKNNWGFLDKQGNWAIRPTLDRASRDFNGGMALVGRFVENSAGDKVTGLFYIDRQGRELGTLNSFSNYFFSDDARIVEAGENEEGTLFSFLDRNGNRLTDKNFKYVQPFTEGLAAVCVDEKWGFIDKTGEFVIEPQFESARSFSEGLAAVTDESDDYGFIDRSGNWAIKPRFEYVENFREGFALVYHDGRKVSPEKTGYIDRTGKFIWKPTK